MSESLIASLRACPILSGFDEAEVRGIAGRCRRLELERNKQLFLEGDPVTAFYIVLEGLVKVYKLSADGKEQVLHLVERGQSFAEASIFGFDVYPAGAAALEASVVVAVPKDHILAMLEKRPDLCQRLLSAQAVWIRRLVDIIASLSFRDVETRLAAYISTLCRRSHGRVAAGLVVDLEIEKSVLAAFLGTIPETLSRALRSLQNKGAVKVAGAQIRITDAGLLEEHLESRQ